jgi:hypothetical protein
LRLTKEGGRRIILNDLNRAPRNLTPHEELSDLFYRLSRSGEFITRYDIEDKIPGVEVVFADNNQSVLKVCAEGVEMRVLIEDKDAEYRQGGAKPVPAWREFSSGSPGEIRDAPSACRNLKPPSSAHENARVINHNWFSHLSQPDGAMFYAIDGEDGGIWKVRDGIQPVKIVSGDYSQQVITPDGKWLVAYKKSIEKAESDRRLIRRNLQSGEEFEISLPQNTADLSLVYAVAHSKVLACRFYSGADASDGYLIDPETGTVQRAEGVFSLLVKLLSRAPQQAGAPNLFWTQVYDWEKKSTSFGRYDTEKFDFTPLLEFPQMNLDNIQVDEAAGKIWFTSEGHLLKLPLPRKSK